MLDDYKQIETLEKISNYLKNHSEDEFFMLRKKAQHKAIYLYFKIGFILFVVYFFICFFWFLYEEDVDKFNGYIYNLFFMLKVPINSPQGWNFPYALSLIFGIITLLITWRGRETNMLLIKRIVTYSFLSYVKVLIAKITILLAAIIFFLAAYKIPAYRTIGNESKCASLRDMCSVRTEDMFYFSTFGCYAMFFFGFMVVYVLLLFVDCDNGKINWRKVL